MLEARRSRQGGLGGHCLLGERWHHHYCPKWKKATHPGKSKLILSAQNGVPICSDSKLLAWKGRQISTCSSHILHLTDIWDSLAGCYNLLHEPWVDRPRLHVFGRSREHQGTEWLQFDELQTAVVVSKCHNGGFYNLWEVIKGFVQSWRRPVTEAKTLFVNACIDG